MAQASRPVFLLLLVTYPPAVHAGVLTGVIWPAIAVLTALLLLPPLLLSFTPGHLLRVVVIAALLALFLRSVPGAVERFVYAPPVLFTLLLLFLFARTLLPGREPLISRVAWLLHENPSTQLLRYTHRVTVAWVFFFALILLEVVLLGMFASRELWSLFTNFYNYLLIMLFLLTEFYLRRFFISASERMPLSEFFRKLGDLDYRKLLWQR
ncbi:MAG: hypothetical protein R6X15_08735 [Pseudomonadota bacterium]